LISRVLAGGDVKCTLINDTLVLKFIYLLIFAAEVDCIYHVIILWLYKNLVKLARRWWKCCPATFMYEGCLERNKHRCAIKMVTFLTFKIFTSNLKGIGSILFLKNDLRKCCRKNYKNHLRSNNFEVCTAVAHCFPNILDVIVLENINWSEDEISRPPYCSNERDLVVYVCFQQCIFQPHVNFIGTLDAEVFNFREKITCFAFYLVLLTEFSTWQSTNLKRRWLDLFGNYYLI
jgi:hypothetical protein